MIEYKLKALTQKRRLQTDYREIFDCRKIECVFFPESSQLLNTLKAAAECKASSESLDPEMYRQAIERFLRIEKRDGTMYIVLPGHSPQIGYTYTRYPLLKVPSNEAAAEVWNILQATTEVPDFLAFCAADFSCGVVVDVFAGDPQLHHTDEPVYDIKIWP